MSEQSQHYPFSAIVGQEEMKLALLLNAIDPAIGGVLLRGEKGSAKSTIVRALGGILPPIAVVRGCPYACDPTRPFADCPHCATENREGTERPTRVVDLPLGATEDRVLGTLHLATALRSGERRFEPGLLAAAHRGILYVDEVNLLADHLVDLLLDAAAMGRNIVEREGIAFAHPARFILIGTMNPEEGELRPQLLDRFGLAVAVGGLPDPRDRAEAVRRRIAYEADPTLFVAAWADAETALRARIIAAQQLLPAVNLPDDRLDLIAQICLGVGAEGLRADLTIYKAARALAAWDARHAVTVDDIRRASALALTHRRRQPFESSGADREEIERQVRDHQERAQQRQPPEHQDNSQQMASDRDAASPELHHNPSEDVDNTEYASRAAKPIKLPAEPGARRPVDGMAARRGANTPPSASIGKPGPSRTPHTPAEAAAPLAVVASLEAAALRQASTGAALGAPENTITIESEDLRVRPRRPIVGRTILFIVDASGSMAAQQRIAVAKGAVEQLLREAYGRRDRVGLISFRGGAAELVLAPTNSAELAHARLQGLPTGGRTPLAHGLRLAHDLLRQPSEREQHALLVILSDGRANVAQDGGEPLTEAYTEARQLRQLGIGALVLDCESGPVRLGLARRLADELGAAYQELGVLDNADVETAVGTIARQRGSNPN